MTARGHRSIRRDVPRVQQYTGCPAAYPVIWCALPNVGHNNSSYGGNNYSPGLMWSFFSMLPK